jgi:rubrerythrin
MTHYTDTRKLIPHDHATEVFVCRACMTQIDPAGATLDGYSKEDCDAGMCPNCGSIDTKWLFAPESGR